MNLLFYFGHPAQYLFLKNTIYVLKGKGIKCTIVIKTKDVLERLLIENNESFFNIQPEGRKSGLFQIVFSLIKRDYRLFKFVKNEPYDIFIGTDPSIAHIGFIKRIPVITVLEDDIQVIPELSKTTFPFTSLILTPSGCKTGKFEWKTIHYDGYMKLAYLHPNQFETKTAMIREPYFLIRLSKLNAYHDANITGITNQILFKIIKLLETKGSVYISSERQLEESLKSFELKINPVEMPQILANAKMLISDSQSMSMEAAMLGVPSIRYSDFAGRISVLEELEQVYFLTFGIPTNSPEKLFEKITELLGTPNLEDIFSNRRQKMLSEKIDVTEFLIWFIENYPESEKILRENPDYQDKYRNIHLVQL